MASGLLAYDAPAAGTEDLFFDFGFLALSAACVPAEIHSPKLIKIKVKIRMS
jgi:hypothetical protein